MKKFVRVLFLYIPLCFIAFSLAQVLLFKWVPVYVTPLMVERCFQEKTSFQGILNHKWVSYQKISIHLKKCVIASEDARFMQHNGFDFVELKKMQKLHEKKGKPLRGCSTISQQTAKNCFTWCTHTWIRKAFEAYYTILIEKIWGKRRILEVYLNIAEMGPDLFGAEAAALHYFEQHADKLSVYQASSLALCLPNPLKRTPTWTSIHMSNRQNEIIVNSRGMANQKCPSDI